VATQDIRQTSESEQPFPNSWIATTAPVALGFLTDVASEVVLSHGEQGATVLWPALAELTRLWCNGEVKLVAGRYFSKGWAPCEALVRIGCREVNRFANRLAERLRHVNGNDAVVWTNAFMSFLTDTLVQSLDMQSSIETKLLNHKMKAYALAKGAADGPPKPKMMERKKTKEVQTQYGQGTIVETRRSDGKKDTGLIEVIKLPYGVLYRPIEREALQDLYLNGSGSGSLGEYPIICK